MMYKYGTASELSPPLYIYNISQCFLEVFGIFLLAGNQLLDNEILSMNVWSDVSFKCAIEFCHWMIAVMHSNFFNFESKNQIRGMKLEIVNKT